MANRIVRTGTALALAMCLAVPLAGQGSSVYTHSSCLAGRGQTGVAAPCDDGSAVYFNPAGVVTRPSAIGLGVTAIWNTGTFTYDSTGVKVERDPAIPLVPHAYATYNMNNGLAFGLGFFAPYGLSIEWPEDTFEGRFTSWRSALRGLYLQPTVAYEIAPGYAIGAGFDVVMGGIEFNRHIDGPVQDLDLARLGVPVGTDIAKAKLEGSGTGFTFNVGILARVHERLTIGARYMGSAKIDLSGTADFEAVATGRTLYAPVGPGDSFVTVALDDLIAPLFMADSALSDQGVTAQITLPPQAVVGVIFRATDRLHLLADYQWTGWETFDKLVGDFDLAPDLTLILDYMNTSTYRFGADFYLNDDVVLRGGFVYNNNATPDKTVTPILPEAKRNYLALGAGAWLTDRLRADVYYNWVNQAARRGRVRDSWTVPVPVDELNVGVYTNDAHVVGLTLAYVFGDAR